jgi:GNAT superfamily N-acetyltransferase
MGKNNAASMIGYKIMPFVNGRLVSMADKRQSFSPNVGTVVRLQYPGIWLSLDRQYVIDYYANNDVNALLTFEFSPHDVARGNLTDRETEFAVTKAKLVSVEVLDDVVSNPANGAPKVKDNPTLSPRDKKVIDAFVARKKASSPTLDSDGRRLHRSVGNEDVARWMGDRIVETSTESTRHDQTILRYLRKKAKTVSGYGQPTYAKGLRFFEGGDALYQGQWDGYIVAYVPQREAPVGRLDYSEYGGKYSIKMVEVDPAYRRYGVSTALFEHLLREHKITQADIDRGMQTEDGHQFRKAVDSYLPNPITRKLKASKQDVPAPFKAAADGLLRWRGVEALGGKDVLAWVQKDGTPAFAFQGPALTIETRALDEERMPINNQGSQADLSLQQAVGLDAKLERGSGWTGVQGGVGQTMSEGEVSLDEVADAIHSILETAIGRRPHFTMMPLEGEPYEGTSTPYYSAKRKKVFEGQAPGNIIKVEVFEDGKDVQKVGVDFCTVADRISETEGGVVGTLSGEDRFFLSHAFSVEGEQVDAKASAKLIKECGGLLYPSLALSDVPANNFGLCTLFFHLGLMVKHIKPYKKPSRGAWQVITYDTDAWTERTRNFAGDASAELYAQLTGQWEPRTYGHMMVLGPEAVEGTAGMGHDVKQVKTVANLRSALKAKRARWKRGMTEEQIEQASDTSSLRYPYLEVKINGILDLGSVPLATCPDFQKKSAVTFLKAIGFRGELIVVKVPEDIKKKLTTYVGGKAEAKALWDYAWLVRDAVIAWQEKKDTKVKKWNEMWLEHVTDGGELSRPKL